MSYLSIDSLEEGHILDEDVHDINGRLLLSRGQEIESKHIRIFKIWGVAEVNIANDTDAQITDTADIDSTKMACVVETVRPLFQNVDLNHPAMGLICRCAIEHRYENNILQPAGKTEPIGKSLTVDLNFKDVQRKLQHSEIKLPEAPALVIELNAVMADPHASASDVARIVRRSPSLTALILKIVNSAAIGLPTKVDSIPRAVSLLGTREISSLAIGISVMQSFSDIPASLIDMTAFLMHSLSCATITRIMAALANIRNTEQLFISGLLHDIGKLILFKYFPEHAQQLLEIQKSEASGRSLLDIEKKVLGITHARTAKLLLKKWNFPESLQDNIVCHHRPSSAHTPAEAAIIQMGDIIAHGTGFGSSGERIIPSFDEKAWEQVGLSANTIKMAIRQAVHQLKTIESVIS